MALDTATIVAPGTTPGSHPAEPSLGTLFRRILAAEWTKLRSVRSTTITLAVTVLVCVGLGALFCYGMVSRWDQRTPQERSLFDPASFSLNALFLGQLIIGALGVLVISAEYSTGTIRATLGAVPQRRAMLAGKAVVFAGVALLFSLVTCLAAFLLGQAILPGKGIGTSLSQPGVLRVVIGGALSLTVVGLLGLGLGTMLRNSAAGISAVLLRSIVPKPKPSSPTTVRYRAPPMTTRGTPGWLRLVPIPLPCRIAWPRRKAAKHVTRENSRATPANTTALPASMARRCGTAPRVALIVPVEYSAEMTRTPSAPMISCPRNSAFRLKDAGSNSDRSCGVR